MPDPVLAATGDAFPLFCAPPRLLQGRGCLAGVPALMARQGWRRALLVTDPFFAAPGGAAARLAEGLAAAGVEARMLDLGRPDPSIELARTAHARAAALAEALGAFDVVVGLGGGSNLDLAKAVAVLLRFGGDPTDWIGDGRLPGAPLPLVAIPTTAGTGSEITPGAILVGEGGTTKVALMANDLRPRVAVIDPALTDTCPPKVTAEAGLDALAHAIESLLIVDAADHPAAGGVDPGYSGRTPLTRLLSLEAIRLIGAALPRAHADGADAAARDAMAQGSLLASLAYGSAGLHAVHAIAYALADLTHASHGATNAVLLPYVMDALVDARAEDLADCARALDPAGEADRAADRRGGDGRGAAVAAARRACMRVRALVDRVGVPVALRGCGVAESDLARLADGGLAVERLTRAFPLRPAGPVYRSIVRRAWAGVFSFEEPAS